MNRDLVLIDGQNLSHRLYWAFQNDKRNFDTSNGLSFNSQETSIIYGFLKHLIMLANTYPDSDFVVAWDSKSRRRIAETDKAKLDGLIETGYKEGRKSMDEEEKESFNNQVAHLQTEILPELSLLQVFIQDFEADDIIYSYTIKYPDRRCIIISSDKDFYQTLSDNVIIHNTQQKEVWTKERFVKEFGFQPMQYIDYGALVGEGKGGDNIPGVDGCGPKGAKTLVSQYGSVGEILKALAVKLPYSKTAKKPKKGEVSNTPPMRTSVEEAVFNSVEKINLSYSLKKMDCINVPDLNIPSKKVSEVKQLLIRWGCVSLIKEAEKLCGEWFNPESEMSKEAGEES